MAAKRVLAMRHCTDYKLTRKKGFTVPSKVVGVEPIAVSLARSSPAKYAILSTLQEVWRYIAASCRKSYIFQGPLNTVIFPACSHLTHLKGRPAVRRASDNNRACALNKPDRGFTWKI